MPGAQMGMVNLGDMLRQGLRRPHQAAAHDGRREPPRADRPRRATSCSTRRRWCARRSPRSSRTASSSSTRSTRSAAAASERIGADVSREGVQRDLLPLIEGTTVATKHGAVKTDHILFIASGAFHLAKPSDLLPELQGRLPIRVELKPLDARRFPPHPDRARGEPDQAIQGAAGDRGRRRSTSPRTRSTSSRSWPRRSTPRSRISARAACTRCWSGCWRRSASPPPTAAGHGRDDRPRLCARPGRRARQERRPVEVHPLEPIGSAIASSLTLLAMTTQAVIASAAPQSGAATSAQRKLHFPDKVPSCGEAHALRHEGVIVSPAVLEADHIRPGGRAASSARDSGTAPCRRGRNGGRNRHTAGAARRVAAASCPGDGDATDRPGAARPRPALALALRRGRACAGEPWPEHDRECLKAG